MQKIQLGCVIENDKFLTDDIFEPIENWEKVQSVDTTIACKNCDLYVQRDKN